MSIVGEADQRAWLLDRAPQLGFTVLDAGSGTEGEEALVVTKRQRAVFGRNNPTRGHRDRVTINHVVYEGLLEVTDVDAFRHTLVAGIGPSKGYGCGLMTLVRP